MPQPSIWRFEALGTVWQIETDQPISDELTTEIRARVVSFDTTYSRFMPDSLVGQVARRAGRYQFPDDVIPMISFYERLYQLSDGRITPLIGSALEKAGYDAKYSFVSQPQQPLPRWDEAMTWHDSTLTTSQPIVLDFGAIGKGYLVDLLASIMERSGLVSYMIDASGDLYTKGQGELRIGLEDPSDMQRVLGVAYVEDASLCASASNRRRWGQGMHHVFDGRTLRPVDDILATWVIAETAMIADGLATALFFCSPEALRSEVAYQYVRQHRDHTIEYSQAFNGEIFT